ncbi:MAG: dienelactone hydrolase family protein [Kofleriaceae bacterium]|nr:dienelactone hydrolase family protein [Myxococcales bacterium]MCB9559345.1 dienelactone hydrolase family protein [Kofleriaceae bacterium]MCB9574029.1 dienelactone hydrolase family protein [Kofleriaceae bacterium]
MTDRVSFKSSSDHTVEGALATPAGDGKAPGVVLLQEYWGINDHVRSLVTRMAAEGFVTLAPDLYHGKVATTAAEAGAMMGALDWPHTLDDIAAAVAYLRAHPRCNGKVAVTGFCLGGALSFATACAVPGLAAVVPFYGVPAQADWSKVDAPILAHFAQIDEWAKPELARDIQQTLQGQGKSMELHVYDAQHAFCNDTRPEVYAPEAAKLAWQRTVDFIRSHTA